MADRHEHARRSRDPMAAIELLDEMESWSEQAWCAGWMFNLAGAVEDVIAGRYDDGHGFCQVPQETRETFRRCRAACGGTWVHGADSTSWRRFVTDEEWDAMGRKETDW